MYAKTVVIGHLGKDPEIRYTPAGVPVCSFSIATSRNWTDANGEKHEKTTWYRISCWRKLAENCAQYLSKGRLVLVEGEVEASAWIDKEGNARGTLELTARDVKFLPSGRGEGQGQPAAVGRAAEEEFGGPSDDDIPF